MKNKDRLLNICNDYCIVVEFLNENDMNTIDTGFLCWLSKDQENIEDAIKNKKTLEIYWPNCNISSASSLKTYIKKATFKKFFVRVLGHGSKYKNCLYNKTNF